MCVPRGCCTKRNILFLLIAILIFATFPLYYLSIVANTDYYEEYLLNEAQMNVSLNNSDFKVPKMIHRTWVNKTIPSHWRGLISIRFT